MSEPASTYSLRQPLPAEVLVGGDAPWNRYQRFPVFSRRWLAGRARVFGVAILCFALLSGVGIAALTGQWQLGARITALQGVAFFLMAMGGPALASWVRHQRWPYRRERAAVVLALLLGMGASFVIDRWSSAEVDRTVRPSLASSGVVSEREPELAPGVRPLATAINLVFLAGIYGLLGGGLALRAYFREHQRWQAVQRTRELRALREHKQQADLRLGLLQAQVEPHFLFNTLASVRALVRKDPAQAEATLDALVAHLRATIPKLRDGQAMLHSTLGQQLDICASYLELMRLRMGGRLSYAVEAEPPLRARPFPPLLLITLVENAIKHGIEPQPGPGRVDVRASLRGDRLVLSVVDDGAGLQPGLGSGVGLANVREQLATRYGGAATFSLRNLAGGRGAVAEIILPANGEGEGR
ncbi:sensor histidine kinase [Arenimonas caeni]|uniref:Sensor histidine kinase n=1 Tax=Arenimonas caeni TaxID=2058085 RepID=A0A2P6MCR4_9GAMM|nr:histidine kinase [Arenimonas caeni]PRH83751.1 sensor histidine kinase [Arenimonas caeni]